MMRSMYGAKNIIILLCIFTISLITTSATAEQYRRNNWLNGWARQENGLNTRGAILIRDGKIGNSGRYWICPYTGKCLYSASDVDIDHIVSLKEAHISGGASWSKRKRFKFANDFDNLLAVYDKENRRKSSKSPVKWKPPLKSYWKEFSRRWRYVKEKWGLRISKKEDMVLRRMEQ